MFIAITKIILKVQFYVYYKNLKKGCFFKFFTGFSTDVQVTGDSFETCWPFASNQWTKDSAHSDHQVLEKQKFVSIPV